MTITIHRDLIQGTDEWLAARCGLLTASEMHLIITPTLKTANNDKSRAHLYELVAQRVTKYVEPHFESFDMMRGHEDELEAVALYSKHYAPVECVGFITNDELGDFTLGYSPDGLVGDNGLIECKSRRQKHQMRTILEYSAKHTIDPDYAIQVQTGLMVSNRNWCDLVSYCSGMPMSVVRVMPDHVVMDAILEAVRAFEEYAAVMVGLYESAIQNMIPTERKVEEEMHV